MREADYRRDGVAPGRAGDAARRRFGNVTYFREQAPRHVDVSIRSKACGRTSASRSGRCANRPASRSSPSSRWRSASAATPRSSAWSTRCARARCPTRIPIALVQLWGNVLRAKCRAPRRLVSGLLRLARAVEKLRGHRRVRSADRDAVRRLKNPSASRRSSSPPRISRCSASRPRAVARSWPSEDVVGYAGATSSF